MKLLVKQATAATFLIIAILLSILPSCASENAWVFCGLASLGVQGTSVDGYDSHDQWSGFGGYPGQAKIATYHQHGDDWSGLTGFYTWDFHAPLVGDRTSTTWYIYSWAQDYWDGGNVIHRVVYPYPDGMPPPWYQARLYLDYVPPAANWEGPTVFDISVTGYTYFDLPIVAVSNPLDGVRMHFTVATPEPSSLLALVGGLAGITLGRRRSWH